MCFENRKDTDGSTKKKCASLGKEQGIKGKTRFTQASSLSLDREGRKHNLMKMFYCLQVGAGGASPCMCHRVGGWLWAG